MRLLSFLILAAVGVGACSSPPPAEPAPHPLWDPSGAPESARPDLFWRLAEEMQDTWVPAGTNRVQCESLESMTPPQ